MIVSDQTAMLHGHQRESCKPEQRCDDNFCRDCHSWFLFIPQPFVPTKDDLEQRL